MQEIVKFFTTIPIAVWSGLFGAFAALAGVIVTIYANHKRLRSEQKYQSVENDKKRFAELRHEVYLEAAKEIVNVGFYIGRLPQIDPQKESIGEGFAGFLTTMGKLQLVAESSTSLLVGKLVTGYGELFMRALTSTVPLQEAKFESDLNNGLALRAQEKVEDILREIATLNKSQNTSRDVFDAHTEYFKFHQEQVAEHRLKVKEATELHIGLQLDFSKWLLLEQQKLIEDTVSVQIAIRQDLGLEDVEAFRKETIRMWEARLALGNKFLQELESKIQSQLKE